MHAEERACVLVIVSDLGLRHALVDWLLSNHGDMIFSSGFIDCYGIDPESMTVAEQVTGRQRKLEFKIQTTLQNARAICNELRAAFPTVHLQYWIQAALEAGYLDGTADKEPDGSD